MGRIADHVATMRGCRLSEIVEAIAMMEAETGNAVSEDDLFNGEANALIVSKGSEFDIVWMDWPSKTAKKAAEKAFNAARKRGVSFKTIEDGIMRYVMTKPADRPWMHLSTFINGERWNDQPAAVVAKGLAGVRANLQQEITDGDRSSGQTSDYHSNAGRLAIGSRFDDERNSRRLL